MCGWYTMRAHRFGTKSNAREDAFRAPPSRNLPAGPRLPRGRPAAPVFTEQGERVEEEYREQPTRAVNGELAQRSAFPRLIRDEFSPLMSQDEISRSRAAALAPGLAGIAETLKGELAALRGITAAVGDNLMAAGTNQTAAIVDVLNNIQVDLFNADASASDTNLLIRELATLTDRGLAESTEGREELRDTLTAIMAANNAGDAVAASPPLAAAVGVLGSIAGSAVDMPRGQRLWTGRQIADDPTAKGEIEAYLLARAQELGMPPAAPVVDSSGKNIGLQVMRQRILGRSNKPQQFLDLANNQVIPYTAAARLARDEGVDGGLLDGFDLNTWETAAGKKNTSPAKRASGSAALS